MTQRVLAERVGVGTPHISKIEAGRENPSDELLRNIAEVFTANLTNSFWLPGESLRT